MLVEYTYKESRRLIPEGSYIGRKRIAYPASSQSHKTLQSHFYPVNKNVLLRLQRCKPNSVFLIFN